jgi:heterodisulfide reductase subunit B
MRLGYYPGCSAEGTALEYGKSIKTSAELLGIDLIELDDWNCCALH